MLLKSVNGYKDRKKDLVICERGLMAPSVAEGFLSESKPLEALGFSRRAGLHHFHTLHAAVGFVPGVLAEISEYLPASSML